MIPKTSSARRVQYLKVKALKKQEELQTRLVKLKREAKQRGKAGLHEELARRARRAENETELAKVSRSCGTSFRSISPDENLTEDSGWMDKSESAKNGHESNSAVSKHSTPENAVKLVHEGKFSAHRRDSNFPTETVGRDDGKNRTKPDNGGCTQGATSQPKVKVANKGSSKLLTAECIQNCSETIIVEKCRQDFHSETLLVDTKQVLEEEIHLVMSEHSIVQTEVNLNYTMTETRKEHRSSAFATSMQTLKESSVQF